MSTAKSWYTGEPTTTIVQHDETSRLRAAVERELTSISSITSIARRLGCRFETVRDMIREIDADEFRRIKGSTDEVRGRHVRILEGIATRVLDQIESGEGRVVRDNRGSPMVEPVLDVEGNPLVDDQGRPVVKPIRDPAKVGEFKVVIAALKEAREVMPNVNAPKTSVNVDLDFKQHVDPAGQEALIHADPVIRDAILTINARRRTLGLAGPDAPPGDGRGGLVRPDDTDGGPVEDVSAPGRDQPPLDASDVGGMPETDDLRSTKTWKERDGLT